MTTLEQLMPRIEAAINLSTADLQGWPSPTRPGIEIAKRQATDDLVKLKKEYSSTFKATAKAMFLTGTLENQKEFAEIAEVEGDTITVDGTALYKRIATKIMPTIGGDKQFGVTQSYIFLLEIQDIMRELGIEEWVAPVNTKPSTVSNEEDMHLLTVHLIQQFGGIRILAGYLEKLAIDKAIDKRYNKSVVPVVITGLTSEEQLALNGLFTGHNVIVELPDGKQVDNDTVIKAFNQLKKKKLETKG